MSASRVDWGSGEGGPCDSRPYYIINRGLCDVLLVDETEVRGRGPLSAAAELEQSYSLSPVTLRSCSAVTNAP